jgi:hypothetical protein
MPHASKQRLEGVSGPDNNAHQAECERHTGPQQAPAETHIAQYVARMVKKHISLFQEVNPKLSTPAEFLTSKQTERAHSEIRIS